MRIRTAVLGSLTTTLSSPTVFFGSRSLVVAMLSVPVSSIGLEIANAEEKTPKMRLMNLGYDISVLDLATSQVEFELNKNSCERNDENHNNKHGEATMVTTKHESESGGEVGTEYHSLGMATNTSVLRATELHISSLLLAAKSPFFHKMFSNGMLESEQKHVTLQIDVSEEAAVMELLKFMYSNSLTVTTTPALLDVLMAADKFEVASCMKHCSHLLLNMPMTLDSALLLLDLPSTLLIADSVKPLTNAAKQFIALRYKDITKFPMSEVMALPLLGFKAILASNDLMVPSENIVYEAVLKWLRSHYSDVKERSEIMDTHLARFIRFPHMSSLRLKKILTSDDFKPKIVSKLVVEALLHKIEPRHHRYSSATEQPTPLKDRFVKRDYTLRLIKIVEFKVPRQQCIVYLDLQRKECAAMYPSGRVFSQPFDLGGQEFFLSGHCKLDQMNLFHCFGLFLGMQEKGPANMIVDYEFSARSKPTDEFAFKYKGNFKFDAGIGVGTTNLFSTSWDSFIATDSPYFINDVLHLRAQLTIRP
ncbi:unnamed protein product [Thlaspi arvense]|uniref:BTB domain-containing protein n=1 Tax=Thlaspi arvense TaxID=13288 RepID=A0AAU9R9R4_THLAR|nr:unnamed protein product [Thlaspi arvense]